MTNLEDRVGGALGVRLTGAQRLALDSRVRTAIVAAPPRGRRLPLKRSLILVAILMIVLPSLFVVGAAILRTENPFGLGSASEFSAEVESAKLVVPLPEGRTWPAHLLVPDNAHSYSVGGGRSWVEFNAACIWFDEWLDSRAAGAVAREATAASTIAAIPTWPSWDSVFWTQSVRDHFTPLLAAVADGDEAPIRGEMQLNCAGDTGD